MVVYAVRLIFKSVLSQHFKNFGIVNIVVSRQYSCHAIDNTDAQQFTEYCINLKTKRPMSCTSIMSFHVRGVNMLQHQHV